jgi:hypothetical protein
MKLLIVLILCLTICLTGACHNVTSHSSEEDAGQPITGLGELSKEYGPAVHLADLEDRAIDESSGMVASHRNPGLFWTHNDSGDGPFLYALDRMGHKRGTWYVTGATAVDWEAIASGPGPRADQPYLYVGDIGDNGKERQEITVYRIPEPVIAAADAETTRSEPRQTEPAEAIRLRYPDSSHNAEALAVQPDTGDLYVITKTSKTTSAAVVYKLAEPFSVSTINTLEKVAEIRVPGVVPGMITDADISPDGRKLIMCDYLNAYELRLPEDSRKFDEIWSQPIAIIRLGQREQGEAICYRLDGQAILATSEKRPAALIEVEVKH